MNLQEHIRKVLKEDRKLSNFLRRRLENLDYEVERYKIWGGHNICIFFKSDIEYFETIMENAIDFMYYNYFSNIDDNSGEWAHIYLDMVNYIRKNYQYKIMKHYDDNCGSGLIPIKESIRKVLKEELNESTYLRRRADMSTIDKKFFTNLNIVTDKYLRKHNNGQYCSFNVFRTTVISYLIDDYRDNLSDNDYDNFPYDEVYNFLLNHFYDKIKDRYNIMFGADLQESIRKVLKEEYKIPLNVRRRLHILRNILGSSLRSSYPCDYDDLDEFIEDIISDVNQYFKWIEKKKEMTSEEAELTIRGYLLDDIKKYYLEEIQNC